MLWETMNHQTERFIHMEHVECVFGFHEFMVLSFSCLKIYMKIQFPNINALNQTNVISVKLILSSLTPHKNHTFRLVHLLLFMMLYFWMLWKITRKNKSFTHYSNIQTPHRNEQLHACRTVAIPIKSAYHVLSRKCLKRLSQALFEHPSDYSSNALGYEYKLASRTANSNLYAESRFFCVLITGQLATIAYDEKWFFSPFIAFYSTIRKKAKVMGVFFSISISMPKILLQQINSLN